MPLPTELGVRVVLWLGATLPRPAPAHLLAALQSMEVTADREKGYGVQLVFTQHVPAALLSDTALAPGNRVIVGVMIGILPHVLIDGIIAHRESADGTLTVTAQDLTLALDKEEKDESYPNQSDSVIATRLIAGHAQLGLVPVVVPTFDTPIMTERTPRQQETDLVFLKRMAERNGYVFYLEPVTFGVTTAYFGPDVRVGIPQPALTKDMGPASNLTSISFSIDSQATASQQGTFIEPFFKTALPIPPLPSLRLPPLASTPLPAMRSERLRDTAKRSASNAATTLLAAATNIPNAVTGTGEVDTARYGHVLRPRGIVGVRGAGLAFDGLYQVDAVTHKLARGAYTQSFRLSREGLGATLPVVPV